MSEHSQAEVVLGRLLPPPRGHLRPPRRQTLAEKDTGANGALPPSSGALAGRTPTTPVDATELVAGLTAGHLPDRVRAVISVYAYGKPLPTTREIARELGASHERVQVALAVLEAAGELALHGRVHRYRLAPGQLHPQDTDFDRAVREGITARRYAPGTALPVGLLCRRHGVSPLRVARACRRLVADRLVAHCEGHAGPGYYVTNSLSVAAQAAATRKEEGNNRV
ncbi:hypothetical protein [Streptomyces anthocyanicus]|uniref:hypothetical protein n=1 Tax=Streptomyces anthocyanicus TaxID=68174 RepID=UPI003804B026